MFKIKRYLSLIVAVLLLVSACASDKSGGDTQEFDGELIINENNSVFRFVAESAEALLPTANIPESLADAVSMIYEPLFDFDENLNPIPVLGVECVRVDQRQYRVTLKSGVKWHDGSDFNANDVIYTVNALKSSENVYSADVKKITQVDFVSKNKVLFTLSEPVVNFKGLLGFPIIKRNTSLSDFSDFVPVGTGSYKFSEKKGGTYSFVKNAEWHGGEASDKTVTITLLKDKQSAVYAFDANEADIISSKLMDLRENTPRRKVSVQEYISNDLTFLGFNTSQGLLSLPEVRRAVAYLIDKDDIVKSELYGRAVAADVPIYPKAWFYNAADDVVEVNVDNTYLERVLGDNGWFKKNGVYTKDFGSYETELTLSILVNSDNEEKKAIAAKLAKILTDNGIIVRVKAYPYDRYLGSIRSGEFSMFIGETAMEKSMDPTDLVKSGKNYFLFSNEETDDILSRMSAAESDEELSALYSEFSGIFLKEMPFVPLFFRKGELILASGLSGFGTPNYYRPYRNVENLYFSQKVELNNQ